MDAHVGKFILSECLAGYLKEKTRILITHKLESLRYADYIYIFKEGTIGAEGNYNQIRETDLFREIEAKSNVSQENEDTDSTLDTTSDSEKGTKERPTDKSSMDKAPDAASNEIISETPTEEANKKAAQIQKQEDKQLYEKLMINEDREVGKVSWDVWRAYFEYYGGSKYFIVLLTGTILFPFFV